MKQSNILFSILFLVSAMTSQAQMGIGTSNPHASAQLELSSSSKGFLPPRISLTATNDVSTISEPATGLLIYNTATAGTAPTNVIPGYYYFDGTNWVNLGAGNFVDLSSNQQVAGSKNFTNGLTVSNQPFLPTRLTQEAINGLSNLVEGMQVYNTTTRKLQVYSVGASDIINEQNTDTYSTQADYIKQTFTTPGSGLLTQIQVYVKGNGGFPFADIFCNVNGEGGAMQFIMDLSTTPKWVNFTLNTPVAVTAGESMYFIMNGPEMLMGECNLGTNNNYAEGGITDWNGSGSLNGNDLMFRIMITPTSGDAYWINLN